MRYFYILLIAMCSKILSPEIKIDYIEEQTNQNYVVMGIIDLQTKKCLFKQAFRDALPGINNALKQWQPLDNLTKPRLLVCINKNGNKSIFVYSTEKALEEEINKQDLTGLYLNPDPDLTTQDVHKQFQSIKKDRSNYQVIKQAFSKETSPDLKVLFSMYQANETKIEAQSKACKIYDESIENGDEINLSKLIASLDAYINEQLFNELINELILKFQLKSKILTLKTAISKYTTNNPIEKQIIETLQKEI